MLEAVNIVLSIFVMIAVGMLLVKIGWLTKEATATVAYLVVNVGLYGSIVSNLFQEFTREGLLEAAPGMPAPFASIILCLLLARLLAKWLKIPEGRRGLFSAMFTFANGVFIGLPVCVALFGNAVAPYALLYYMANTSLFWSFGYAMIVADTGKIDAKKRKWYKAVPFTLLTFIICVLLILFGVRPPEFFLSAAKYLGGMVTPLSLLYTGAVVMRMIEGRRVRWEKGYLAILIGRFLIAPALFLLLSRFINMPLLMRNTLFMQSAMPVMAQIAIVTGQIGADGEYAAGAVTLSTLLSLGVIPVYMLVVGML